MDPGRTCRWYVTVDTGTRGALRRRALRRAVCRVVDPPPTPTRRPGPYLPCRWSSAPARQPGAPLPSGPPRTETRVQLAPPAVPEPVRAPGVCAALEWEIGLCWRGRMGQWTGCRLRRAILRWLSFISGCCNGCV